jgi:hypothetical protein
MAADDRRPPMDARDLAIGGSLDQDLPSSHLLTRLLSYSLPQSV